MWWGENWPKFGLNCPSRTPQIAGTSYLQPLKTIYIPSNPLSFKTTFLFSIDFLHFLEWIFLTPIFE